MNDWLLVAFAIGCGYSAAGVVASVHGLFDGGRIRFVAVFGSFGDAVWSVLLSALGGPYIVAGSALRSWRRRGISTTALAAAGLLCAVWSFCSGVLLLQMLALAGIVNPQ